MLSEFIISTIVLYVWSTQWSNVILDEHNIFNSLDHNVTAINTQFFNCTMHFPTTVTLACYYPSQSCFPWIIQHSEGSFQPHFVT